MESTKFVSYSLGRLLFSVALFGFPVVFYGTVFWIGAIALVYKLATWARFYWKKHDFDATDRAVFITGCDSGLGHAFARHLDKVGFTVFAGVLNEKGEGASHLTEVCSKKTYIVPVNVTKDESITAALEFVKKKLPPKGLWGVMNNAGMNVVGEVEFTTVALYEKGLEVNLYGPIRIMKTFLPLIRASQGRIVNITSVHGRFDGPRQSNYEVAKHGLETVSDSLRMEMNKFGVHVAIVEPGMYGYMTSIENEDMVQRKTAEVEEMWNSASPDIKNAYTKSYVMSWLNKPMVHGWTTKSRDIRPVSKAVEHALCSGSPRERYLVGGVGTILAFIDELALMARLYSIFPTWLTDAAWMQLNKET